MSYALKGSIVIGVPPEQVFDYLLDLRAHMEWGDMAHMEILDEGPVQVGTRWLSAGSTSGVDMRDQCEIVALERPHRFAFKSRSQSGMGVGTIVLTYTMEPVPEGTRLTFTRVIDRTGAEGLTRILLSIPGFESLVVPVTDKLMAVKTMERGLENLRQRLEQRAA